MTILAIDPGPTETALVVWNGVQILFARKVPNAEAMRGIESWITLMDQVRDVAPNHRVIEPLVKHVVCERVECYGMPVGKEVFETCFWTGRMWQLVVSIMGKTPFHLIPRREVKLNLCGQARAKDGNIRQALIDRFGGKGTKAAPGVSFGMRADLWQAWALAVTALDKPALLAPSKT